jgi:hypothetical protein
MGINPVGDDTAAVSVEQRRVHVSDRGFPGFYSANLQAALVPARPFVGAPVAAIPSCHIACQCCPVVCRAGMLDVPLLVGTMQSSVHNCTSVSQVSAVYKHRRRCLTASYTAGGFLAINTLWHACEAVVLVHWETGLLKRVTDKVCSSRVFALTESAIFIAKSSLLSPTHIDMLPLKANDALAKLPSLQHVCAIPQSSSWPDALRASLGSLAVSTLYCGAAGALVPAAGCLQHCSCPDGDLWLALDVFLLTAVQQCAHFSAGT